MPGALLDNYFKSKNYKKAIITNQIYSYGNNRDNSVKMCVVVDNTGLRKYSSLELNELEMKFRQDMSGEGYDNLEILFLVYTDNVARDRELINYINVWLLDVKSNKIIVYDNQPQNFDGIEAWIEDIAFSEKNSTRKISIPIVSIILILINVLVYIALESKGSTLDVYFMLNHGASSWELEFKEMELYRLFTCMFIHFGIEHLVNNMFMLYMIGVQIEKIYGRGRFLFIYLLSGLFASLVSSMANMLIGRNDIISGGASGAIYGIMGAMIIVLWFNRKQAGEIIYRFIILVILMVYGGFTDTGVDNVAHIAGFFSGIVIGGIVYMTSKKQDIKNAS